MTTPTRIYDLDTSGGLMDEIQALIAPPGSSSSKTNKKDEKKQKEHPYFKRPGKGHNHDFCHSCNEGGDLICCDVCPCSFHLLCHDPPLSFEDIPEGKWLCHSCRYKKEALKKRPDSATKLTKKSSAKMNPLAYLIELAKGMNPVQFELPLELQMPHIIFPGSDKVESPKLKKGKQRDHEKLPSGLVPLPGKKCHECRRSCRVAPLIECDYCPLYFHLDCLNPPLTTAPTAMWMCPLHVQHTLDSTLLTSVSLSERIALWEKYSQQPIDEDAVKRDFLRKIYRENPPFTFKRQLPRKPKFELPGMILQHYQKPVRLLPSLRDVLRFEYVYRKKKFREAVLKLESNENNQECKENADEEFITIMGDDKKVGEGEDSKPCDTNYNKNKASTPSIEFDNTADTPGSPRDINMTNTELTVSVGCENTKNYGISAAVILEKEKSVAGDIMDGYFSIVGQQDLKLYDQRLIRILAHERLQQLVGTANLNMPKMPLPTELLTPGDIERLSRALDIPNDSESTIRARAMLCPILPGGFYNISAQGVDVGDVRRDVSFMNLRPLVSVRPPEAVAMRYRVINVGKGSSNEVNLDKYGHCKFIAPLHATIFFDENEKCYELVNYAPYGTQVNNVLYSNNISLPRADSPKKGKNQKGANSANPLPEEKAARVESQVRELIGGKKRGRGNVKSNKMPAPKQSERDKCACNSGLNQNPTTGWEGSAILQHGSLIKFGCIGFVFSIVDDS